MTKIRTTYLGNLETETEHLNSGVKIKTTAPSDNHGTGETFSPSELFVTSYITCVLTMTGIAAKTHNFNIDGTIVEAEAIKGGDPTRIVEIKVTFTFPGTDYTEREIRLIEAAMKKCPVGNSLRDDLKISKEIKYGI